MYWNHQLLLRLVPEPQRKAFPLGLDVPFRGTITNFTCFLTLASHTETKKLETLVLMKKNFLFLRPWHETERRRFSSSGGLLNSGNLFLFMTSKIGIFRSPSYFFWYFFLPTKFLNSSHCLRNPGVHNVTCFQEEQVPTLVHWGKGTQTWKDKTKWKRLIVAICMLRYLRWRKINL